MRPRLLAASALCIGASLVLAVLVGRGGAPGIDRAVADAMHANRIDELDRTWRAIALLCGSAGLGVVVLASCVFAWRRGGPRWLAFLLGSYLGTEILFWALKAATDRPRPPLSLRLATVGSPSYPSGHTAIATAVAASLLVAATRTARPRLRRPAVAGLVALPVVVGVSRIALGVHWLTDVVGGALLGAGWVLALAGLGLPGRSRIAGSADPVTADPSQGYGRTTGRPQAPSGKERRWDSRSSTSRSSGPTETR